MVETLRIVTICTECGYDYRGTESVCYIIIGGVPIRLLTSHLRNIQHYLGECIHEPYAVQNARRHFASQSGHHLPEGLWVLDGWLRLERYVGHVEGMRTIFPRVSLPRSKIVVAKVKVGPLNGHIWFMEPKTIMCQLGSRQPYLEDYLRLSRDYGVSLERDDVTSMKRQNLLLAKPFTFASDDMSMSWYLSGTKLVMTLDDGECYIQGSDFHTMLSFICDEKDEFIVSRSKVITKLTLRDATVRTSVTLTNEGVIVYTGSLRHYTVLMKGFIRLVQDTLMGTHGKFCIRGFRRLTRGSIWVTGC